MNGFNLYATLVEAIYARNDLLDRQVAIRCIDNLILQRVLVILIDHEISRKSLVEERVAILKDNLYVILGMLA